MLYLLRGHVQGAAVISTVTSSDSARIAAKHVRELFWTCYLFDKDVALATGQPPMLADEYCNMSNLEDFDSSSSSDAVNMSVMPDDIAWQKLVFLLPTDSQIGPLKDKIFRLLYSGSGLAVSDSELLTRIRLLDDDLESWRVSVRAVVRPALSRRSRHGSIADPYDSLVAARLQLDYNYLVVIIHSTVRRFGSGVLPEDLHGVMHSSIDLTLEASRCTIHLMRGSESDEGETW